MLRVLLLTSRSMKAWSESLDPARVSGVRPLDRPL